MLRIIKSWRQYIAIFLIFILLISQTIRVDFFSQVNASQDTYREIVSIFVDRQTYSSNRAKINRYAEDIQNFLGSTQSEIYVVGPGVNPSTIAAQNEKLYYEGNGSRDIVSRLVGTILIGNIDIPMVHYDNDEFPSVYPYVDFVDKKFVYDESSKRYIAVNDGNQKIVEPEIWHGVINPAVGRTWDNANDVQSISKFLDKTHDFYSKNGVFTTSDKPPRVFYYDGFSETSATDARSLFQYALNMNNSENLAYNRFTKYLLKDISSALEEYDAEYKAEDNALLASVGVDAGSDSLSSEIIDTLPDIQTQPAIEGLLKDFHAIINKKALSDELLFVRNAGRYSSGNTVRADLGATMMTSMDTVARSTLAAANDTLIDSIDKHLIDNGYIKSIPIFDTFSEKKPVEVEGGLTLTGCLLSSNKYGCNEFVYQNYYFGTKSSEITHPSQCTIARGSLSGSSIFGKPVLVEANTMYDVGLAEPHAEKLEVDTTLLVDIHKSPNYACFNVSGSSPSPKAMSYWGDNSILSLATSGDATTMMSRLPAGTVFSNMTESVYSLAGMKETERITPASLTDCTSMKYQYAIQNPMRVKYIGKVTVWETETDTGCFKSNLNEWNVSSYDCSKTISPKAPDPLRYSCLSDPPKLTVPHNFVDHISRYRGFACLVGDLTLNGSVIINANRECVETVGFGDDVNSVDNSIYESVSYHTVPGILRHVSPTTEELLAAQTSGVTPSLPVDIVRYVEFLTPKGNIARINYPNFFESQGDDIESFRLWLSQKSQSDWNQILAQENSTTLSPAEVDANTYLVTGNLPDAPVDWNILISDDVITKVIQARNWMNPDVSKKYTKAIESMLSYSQNSSGIDTQDPPQLPTIGTQYEVAYLGLTSFSPLSAGYASSDSKTAIYDSAISKIKAINISEKDADLGAADTAPSDSCGPPDGVNLFQWPSAIMCWIKSLTPIRIVGMACGLNTIGLKSSTMPAMVSPLTKDTETLASIKSFYTGGVLVSNIDKKNILPNESTSIKWNFVKNGKVLTFPDNTAIKLEVVSGTNASGSPIIGDSLSKALLISPNPMVMSNGEGSFVLGSQGIKGTYNLQAQVRVLSSKGEEYIIDSQTISIKVSDEYLDVTPWVNGSIGSVLPVTSSTGIVFDFSVKKSGSIIAEPSYPIIVDIYDDVSNQLVSSGIIVSQNKLTLSTTYTKEVGVFRFEFRDQESRSTTHTIAVQAGKLSRANFAPISSAILQGSNTPVILRLRDALGNPIAPDLHSIDLQVDGGYFILENGDKKTSLHIDSMDSEVPLTLGSDTLGTIALNARVDNTIQATTDIRVFDSAQVVIKRTEVPRVGGDNTDIRVHIVGSDGAPLSGLNSIVHLSLPEGAGSFYPNVVTIENGISQLFEYIPGQLAGEHNVTASIPGLGVIPDIGFTVDPGIPLYITHTENNSTIEFTLRDRYDNLSPVSLPGKYQINAGGVTDIQFDSGKYSIPRQSGMMSVEVPQLAMNTLQYSDSEGTYTLTGMQFYTAYISSPEKKFDFYEDYNARYTILAGGSFLREAEDILYNNTVGKSQSLAATTLLDSPMSRDSVVSFLPGGAITTVATSDIVPESSISLVDGYPRILFQDIISQRLISAGTYRATDPGLDICQGVDCLSNRPDTSHIRVESLDTHVSPRIVGDTVALIENEQSIVSVLADGRITHVPGITLSLDDSVVDRGIIIEASLAGRLIARIYYATDKDTSVGVNSIGLANTVTVQDFGVFSSELFAANSLGSSIEGIRFFGKKKSNVIDSKKNGPDNIDSLGLLSELPGVGWQGSNRMLLSYAGGDTVGESSRWFHTYTMVNLGDPVTHNDKRAPGTELDGIDRSIGTQLTSSLDSPVQSYIQADMTNDGIDDIVVLHTDGYVELLLNLVDRIRSKGNIAYIPDIVSRGFSAGDFVGDGFSDILGLDKEGSFVLLANTERQFARMKLSLGGSAEVPTGISQFKIYDMDADNRDDIIYISQSGELAILYGTATQGSYEKKILDSTLGITLSTVPVKSGGAIYANHIPQVSLESDPNSSELDESRLYSEIYYPFELIQPITEGDLIDTSTSQGRFDRDIELTTLSRLEDSYATSDEGVQDTGLVVSNAKNYIRSEYAPAQGIDISKTYTNINSPTIHAGDTIKVTIDIKNSSSRTIESLKYLDTIPAIFDASKVENYSIRLGSNSIQRKFQPLGYSDFDAFFNLPDLSAGETLQITYEVIALPASYGKLLVGDYEKGETGIDIYGDVGFQSETTCGADMLLWRSDSARAYTQGTRTFTDVAIPPTISDSLDDADSNGVPDSMEDMSRDEAKDLLKKVTSNSSFRAKKDMFNINLDPNRQILDIGFDDSSITNLQNQVQDIMDGLACGFGGGSCMSFPINWAPLAPGSAPVAFGYPLGALVPSTGLPLFSGITGIPVTFSCGPSCLYTQCLPATYPASPLGFGPPFVAPGPLNPLACSGGLPGAGGILGSTSPANNIRIYVTPTLTLGAGAAFCFGGPSIATGNIPPPAAWPLVPGGNCIVIAKPLSMCKDDGSAADGDVRGISGLGTIQDTWNAKSCNIKADTGGSATDDTITQDVLGYLRAPNKSQLSGLYTRLGNRGSRSISAGPFLKLGGASSGGALSSVDITIDSAKPLNFGNIVKLKNKRIAGFPDFIMDWVSRQTDEVTNALLTPPNLIIIKPTSVGQNAQFDGSLSGLTDTFKKTYNDATFDNISKRAGDAYSSVSDSTTTSRSLESRTRSSKNQANTEIGKWIQEQQNSFDGMQDSAFKGQLGKIANQGQGGIAAMRAAYKLVGKLPLISISEKTIPVNVPWILPQELDRYSRSMDAYSKEFDSALASFCANDPTPECAAKKAKLQSSGLRSSINQNLKRIEEYKNFPVKLQKYVTWKQRYLSQVLCYITEIQQMTTGWVKDNSLRFQKWAELIVLIRAIADSWQPILDIVAQKDAQCSVCRNERYNAKYFKYKIISALIPSIPVIKFPRWPDIVLDLSDVRFGIVLFMPNFQFNLKPIRLPDLPRFSLPRGPNVSLTLPNLDLLPPIPTLPNLPDLPAIPTIKLPNLPPPPKLPKLFASLAVGLKILKLFKIMECYVNKTTLVPEWTAGDVIAQRTERQGTFSLDFLDISLPQISLPSIREIRVSSHVNFELRSEFVAEFAQAAVQPINQFNADMGRGIPKKIGDDIRIDAPKNIDLRIESSLPREQDVLAINESIQQLEKNASVLLSLDEFKSEMLSQFALHPELSNLSQKLNNGYIHAQHDTRKEMDELLTYQNTRFERLREYIDLQYAETSHMQNIIDLLTQDTHTLASGDMDRALMVSNNIHNQSSELAESWNQDALIFDESTDINQSDVFEDQKNHIQGKMNRLLAAVDTTTSTATETTQGYAPNFQGIYIVTENGNQTRLFDYIEPLVGDEISTKTDLDGDGDMDYLFLLDGVLYIKKTSTNSATKIIDDTRKTVDMNNNVKQPIAPNFFHEDIALSNTISFSYDTTRASDSMWRVELYDRYMEWDNISQGEYDPLTTPRHIIDLSSSSQDISRSKLPVLKSVSRPDAIVIQGPKLQVLADPVDFTLSPGRILYAGNRDVTILYSTGNQLPSIRKSIDKFEELSFSEPTNISLKSGTVYITYPTILGETYEYSDDLIGMPILPNMRIAVGDGEVELYDTITDKDIVLQKGSTYRYQQVSSLDKSYSIQIPFPNGYYYPKIRNLTTGEVTSAGEILFSPQASNDTSAPVIDVGTQFRVPVYQSRDILMRDIITESSQYSVTVDSDISQDSDGNGIFDDDFSQVGTGIQVVDTSKIKLGIFDTIGTRNILMKVTDEFYNTTIVPVAIEVYSPIPQITQANTEGTITGVLSEELIGEPIHLFRVRPGSDITPITDTPILTHDNGGFTGIVVSNRSGATITNSLNTVSVSERGIFGDLPSNYSAQVILANSDNPQHIVLYDATGKSFYKQFFSLPDDAIIINSKEDSRTLVQYAIFVTPADGYSVVPAKLNDPSIPGGVYITNSELRPIVAIARDGNIYPIASDVGAIYSKKDGYPQIILKEKGTTFGEVLYKFDFFYTLK